MGAGFGGGTARWALLGGLALIAFPAASATHTITIEGMQFSPALVTVQRGDEVVWVNKDFVPHTVTAAKVFDSGAVPSGKSWRMTATQAGRYDYVCTFHPTMRAVLVVK